MIPDRAVKRFWEQVEKSDGCWVWTGCKINKEGYGGQRIRGVLYPTHRLSWILRNGPIPQGLQVLHHCDNPPCVNPDHLFIGTIGDNMKDKAAKGRAVNTPQVGVVHWKARLTELDVKHIRELRTTTDMTMRDIGEAYGITKEHVFNILKRIAWKHVT